MKKITVNIKEEKQKSLSWIWGCLIWIGLAFALGYIVYPSLCLSKVTDEFEVINKTSEYTYYKQNNDTIVLKRLSSIPIGETEKLEIKIKDHPKYRNDNNATAEKYIFGSYIITVFLGIVSCLYTYLTTKPKISLSERKYIIFMGLSAILSIIMFILWEI